MKKTNNLSRKTKLTTIIVITAVVIFNLFGFIYINNSHNTAKNLNKNACSEEISETECLKVETKRIGMILLEEQTWWMTFSVVSISCFILIFLICYQINNRQ